MKISFPPFKGTVYCPRFLSIINFITGKIFDTILKGHGLMTSITGFRLLTKIKLTCQLISQRPANDRLRAKN
jgi:hypothetical protein